MGQLNKELVLYGVELSYTHLPRGCSKPSHLAAKARLLLSQSNFAFLFRTFTNIFFFNFIFYFLETFKWEGCVYIISCPPLPPRLLLFPPLSLSLMISSLVIVCVRALSLFIVAVRTRVEG